MNLDVMASCVAKTKEIFGVERPLDMVAKDQSILIFTGCPLTFTHVQWHARTLKYKNTQLNNSIFKIANSQTLKQSKKTLEVHQSKDVHDK